MNKSSIGLKELLRLAFTEPVRWLSGNRDDEIMVNWIAISLENVQKDDLLVIQSADLTPKLIDRAKDLEISSILILGQVSRKIGKSTTGISLIALEEEDDIRLAQRRLINVLVNQRASYLESGFRVHKQLSKLAAEGLQIEGIARALLEISGRGVLIQDKRLNILAEFPAVDLQSIWDDITERLSSIESLPSSLQDRNQAGQQSLTISQNIPGGIARIVTPISVGEVARGYLSLIGMEGELDSFDRVIAEEGALVCAMEMARSKAVRETEKRLQGDLLTALLQEDLSPRDAGLWVQTMGLDQTQEHVALQFAWDSDSPPSRRRLETIVNGEVMRVGAKVIINPTGSNVICFCQVPPDEPRPATALDLGKSILERAMVEYPEARARCGIGTPASDLNKWQISFRESGQALEMAFRLSESKPLYFPDLSIYRLLLLIEPHPELEVFKEEILGALLSYEGGDTLVTTLEAYFANNANLSKTAEALYIHRNTLTYRMDRISEITGLDLTNPDTSLSVQIALRIHRMIDKE
jgi:purine catabolism regulator